MTKNTDAAPEEEQELFDPEAEPQPSPYAATDFDGSEESFND